MTQTQAHSPRSSNISAPLKDLWDSVLFYPLWRTGAKRTHHKVAQIPFRLQANGGSEPPKTVNPNIFLDHGICLRGRTYPAPTMATLKSGLGSKAMFSYGGVKERLLCPTEMYTATYRCAQGPKSAWY
jgi:hypothetical protein